MKLRTLFVFLLIMALLDTLIVYIWPPDFTFQAISCVPHLCFMALLLLVYKRNWIDRVLMGILCGLIYDYFFLSIISFMAVPNEAIPCMSDGIIIFVDCPSDNLPNAS